MKTSLLACALLSSVAHGFGDMEGGDGPPDCLLDCNPATVASLSATFDAVGMEQAAQMQMGLMCFETDTAQACLDGQAILDDPCASDCLDVQEGFTSLCLYDDLKTTEDVCGALANGVGGQTDPIHPCQYASISQLEVACNFGTNDPDACTTLAACGAYFENFGTEAFSFVHYCNAFGQFDFDNCAGSCTGDDLGYIRGVQGYFCIGADPQYDSIFNDGSPDEMDDGNDDCATCVSEFVSEENCACLLSQSCDASELIPPGCEPCGSDAIQACSPPPPLPPGFN